MRDKERRSSKKFKIKERKKYPYKKTRKKLFVQPTNDK